MDTGFLGFRVLEIAGLHSNSTQLVRQGHRQCRAKVLEHPSVRGVHTSASRWEECELL